MGGSMPSSRTRLPLWDVPAAVPGSESLQHCIYCAWAKKLLNCITPLPSGRRRRRRRASVSCHGCPAPPWATWGESVAAPSFLGRANQGVSAAAPSSSGPSRPWSAVCWDRSRPPAWPGWHPMHAGKRQSSCHAYQPAQSSAPSGSCAARQGRGEWGCRFVWACSGALAKLTHGAAPGQNPPLEALAQVTAPVRPGGQLLCSAPPPA